MRSHGLMTLVVFGLVFFTATAFAWSQVGSKAHCKPAQRLFGKTYASAPSCAKNSLGTSKAQRLFGKTYASAASGCQQKCERVYSCDHPSDCGKSCESKVCCRRPLPFRQIVCNLNCKLKTIFKPPCCGSCQPCRHVRSCSDCGKCDNGKGRGMQDFPMEVLEGELGYPEFDGEVPEPTVNPDPFKDDAVQPLPLLDASAAQTLPSRPVSTDALPANSRAFLPRPVVYMASFSMSSQPQRFAPRNAQPIPATD